MADLVHLLDSELTISFLTALTLFLWLFQMSNSHSKLQKVSRSFLTFVNGSHLSTVRRQLANKLTLFLRVRKLKHSTSLRRESETVIVKNSTSLANSQRLPTDSFLLTTIRESRIHLTSSKKLSVNLVNHCVLKSEFQLIRNFCCQQNAIFTWWWTFTGLIHNLRTSLTLISSLSKLWSTKFAFNLPRENLFPTWL